MNDTDFIIIYPNGGTKEKPSNIIADKRYVEKNPFAGYHVSCIVQVFHKNMWSEMSSYTNESSGRYYCQGGKALQLLVVRKILCKVQSP